MKKTALTILSAVLTCISASSQSAYDAWLFSENNYEGTARSVAMGNAFTALGGDLGAVSINPAGSAVASYSQLTITPSITFSTNTAAGVPYEGSSDPYFQDKMRSRMSRAGFSNIGFSFNFNTGRTSGLKSVTAGFVANRSNSWCEDTYARGTNNQTSFLAAAAADAQAELIWMNDHKAPGENDFTSADYLTENAYDYMNWKDIVGYCSNMFSSIDDNNMRFAGATEYVIDPDNHQLAGPVHQTYGRSVSGSKYEYLLNIGANISDFVYVGFNLGFNSLSYDYAHYFKESALDPADFENVFLDKDGNKLPPTYFSKATYRHDYSAEGTGVFGKLGVIVTPGHGIRVGAAIQTPTAMTIEEEYRYSGSTEFTDSQYNGKETSPEGMGGYRFNSPWRFNLGLAYTLGRFAVISADYEAADYRSMGYKIDRHDMSEADIEHFESTNEDIRQSYGTAHHLRLGAEVRPLSVLAVRAGYNLNTSAQKKFYDSLTDEYVSMDTVYGHNISFGAGYSSKKSFFADLACRYTLPSKEYILPYSDYLYESTGVRSPEILNRHSNWKVLLTLGWRF